MEQLSVDWQEADLNPEQLDSGPHVSERSSSSELFQSQRKDSQEADEQTDVDSSAVNSLIRHKDCDACQTKWRQKQVYSPNSAGTDSFNILMVTVLTWVLSCVHTKSKKEKFTLCDRMIIIAWSDR